VTAFTDDFAGTAGTLVSTRAGWTAVSIGNQIAQLNGSNQCAIAANTSPSLVLHNNGGTDHYAQCDIQSALAGVALEASYLVVRGVASSRGTGYASSWDGSTHRIRRLDTLGVVSSVAGTLAAGDTIKLQVLGTQLILFKNGTAIITTTDTSFTAGTYSGIAGIGPTTNQSAALDPFIDNFAADVVGATTVKVPWHHLMNEVSV
jgi:hypothetical protein